MGYKKMNWNMTFAEIDQMTSMEHNRSLKMMEKINKIINWSEIEAVLLKHYTTGTAIDGADAYPPLMLMKALLPQKWFQIHSDPELENQICPLLRLIRNYIPRIYPFSKYSTVRRNP